MAYISDPAIMARAAGKQTLAVTAPCVSWIERLVARNGENCAFSTPLCEIARA